jgi:hypothetical protein
MAPCVSTNEVWVTQLQQVVGDHAVEADEDLTTLLVHGGTESSSHLPPGLEAGHRGDIIAPSLSKRWAHPAAAMARAGGRDGPTGRGMLRAMKRVLIVAGVVCGAYLIYLAVWLLVTTQS